MAHDAKEPSIFLRKAKDWTTWYRWFYWNAHSAKLFIYIDIDKDEPQLLEPPYPIPEIYIEEVNAKTLARHQLSV